jgi:hypothetical protein
LGLTSLSASFVETRRFRFDPGEIVVFIVSQKPARPVQMEIKRGEMETPEKDEKIVWRVKKCPECLAHLPLDAKRCHECNIRVGPVDRHGKAKRTINWIAYLVSAAAWVAFGYFMWWAFRD